VGDLIMKLNPIIRDNIWSRRKLAKQSNYKCRVCNQSLVGEEELKINQIIPKY
jgi:RNA-directed DNA polymerase